MIRLVVVGLRAVVLVSVSDEVEVFVDVVGFEDVLVFVEDLVKVTVVNEVVLVTVTLLVFVVGFPVFVFVLVVGGCVLVLVFVLVFWLVFVLTFVLVRVLILPVLVLSLAGVSDSTTRPAISKFMLAQLGSAVSGPTVQTASTAISSRTRCASSDSTCAAVERTPKMADLFRLPCSITKGNMPPSEVITRPDRSTSPMCRKTL